jgi:hypothetical protein
MIGRNLTPSTAVNQLEMRQTDTFDPATIERELGWAQNIGFNRFAQNTWRACAEAALRRTCRCLKPKKIGCLNRGFVAGKNPNQPAVDI